MKQLKNILEYGLYAFVFLLPWQTKLILRSGWLNRGVWDYGTIVLYGTDILLAALLIVFFILSWKTKQNNRDVDNAASGEIASSSRSTWTFRNDRMVWIILSGLDLIFFISILFAPDKALALYRYVIFLLGLGLFWLLLKTTYDKARLAIAFFSGLVIQGVLAVQQFLMQETFASKWLGMAAHLPINLGVSVVETRGSDGVAERWLRAYGSLDHPNILGGVMAIGLIILILVIANYKRPLDKKYDWKFIAYYLSLIVIAVGLIFSFSRSALFAFAVGMAIFFIFSLFKKDWLKIKKAGGAIIVFIILFGAIFASYQSLFVTRAIGAERLETNSSFERRMYLNDSLALIKKNWLIGSGIGNYTKALSETDLRRPWYYLQPVHNVFLLVWEETGIFGLLFYIFIFVYFFWQSLKKNNVVGLSVLPALAIIMMFDHYIFSMHFGILFFFGLLGYLIKSFKIAE